MSVIVNIRLESDLSEFTTTVTDSGDLYWSNGSTAQAVAGSNGALACLIDDTTQIYGYKDFAKSPIIRFRFYVDPNSLSIPTDNSFKICTFDQAGGLYAGICYVYLGYSNSTGYFIKYSYLNDAYTESYSSNYDISDAPHYIEVKIVQATNEDSNNGTVQLWIDGVNKGSTSGIDNCHLMSDYNVRMYLGAKSVPATTSGTFYLDELVINNDGSEIGQLHPLPRKTDLQTMNYHHKGQPFVKVGLNKSVELDSLDYHKDGQPFWAVEETEIDASCSLSATSEITSSGKTTIGGSASLSGTSETNIIRSSTVVNIHFENNLNEFTSLSTDGGDLYWSGNETARNVAGSNGALACLIDDTNVFYGIRRFTKSSVLRWRIYIDPNGLTMANADSFRFLNLQQRAGSYSSISSAYLNYFTASGYGLSVYYKNDGGTSFEDTKTMTDIPHYLEFKITSATTDISSDGTFQWWYDGIDQGTFTGIDNYNLMNDQTSMGIEVGAGFGIDAGTSGTFYLDEIVVNDDGSEIGPYNHVLFNIKHEDGDFREYTSTIIDGGDLSISGSAALARTNYGMACFIDDAIDIYGERTFSLSSNVLRARFYINPNSVSMATNDTITIFRIRDASVGQNTAKVELVKSATSYQIRFSLGKDDGGFTQRTGDITNESHYVEFKIVRATTSISNNGILQAWIDGVQVGTTSITNDNYDYFATADRIRLGTYWSSAGITGTVYLDELVLNNDGSEIGPLVFTYDAEASLSATSEITAVGTKTSGGATHDGASDLSATSQITTIGIGHNVLPSKQDYQTLDFYYMGQPFGKVATNKDENFKTLDYYKDGQPWYGVEDTFIHAECNLLGTSEIVTFGDVHNIFPEGEVNLLATSSMIPTLEYPEDYILRNAYFGKRGTLVGYWQRISYYDTHEAYANLNGNSELTSLGTIAVDGTLNLSGISELSVIGNAIKDLTTALSATSELLTVGKRTADIYASLLATSELVSDSKTTRDASSALSGTSEMLLVAKRTADIYASLSATSELISISKVTRDAYSALSGNTELVSSAKNLIGAYADLQAQSQIIIASIGDKLGYANLIGNSELISNAITVYSGNSTLNNTSELTALGKKTIDGYATFTGTSEITTAGKRYAEAFASLTGNSELISSAFSYKESYASLSATSELLTSGICYINGSSNLQSNSQLLANAIKYISGYIDLVCLSQLTPAGQNVISGQSSISATSSILTEGIATHPLDYILRNTYFGKRGTMVGYWQILSKHTIHNATSDVIGMSELIAEVSGEQLGTANLSATSLLTVSAKLTYGAYSSLSGLSEINSIGRITINGASGISTESELLSRGKLSLGAYANIDALSEMIITSSGDRLGFATLSAESLLTVLGKTSYAGYSNLNTLSELIASGKKTINTSADINATSQMLTAGIRYVQIASELSGLSSLLSSGFIYKEAYSGLSGSSQLLSSAIKYLNGFSGLQANSQLLTNAIKYLNATSILTADSQLLALGRNLLSGALTLNGLSELLLATAGDKNAFASLLGESLLIPSAKALYSGYLNVNGNSSMISTAKNLIGATSGLFGLSQLISVGKVAITGNINIQTLSEMLLSTKVDRPGFVGLSGLSQLIPSAGIRFDGSLGLNANSSLSALGKREINVLSDLLGFSELISLGQNVIGGQAALLGNSELNAEVLLIALICILRQSYINRSINRKSRISKSVRTDEWYQRQ